MVDDDVGIFGHAAGEYADLVVVCHFCQELEHVGSDQKLALVFVGDFVVDQSLVQIEQKGVLFGAIVMQVGRRTSLQEVDVPGAPVHGKQRHRVELQQPEVVEVGCEILDQGQMVLIKGLYIFAEFETVLDFCG